MPNGPPNPWSESNSPSLRQNQGGSLRPGVAGFGGVFLGDLVAVAEHFGDDRWRYLRYEFAKGSVA